MLSLEDEILGVMQALCRKDSAALCRVQPNRSPEAIAGLIEAVKGYPEQVLADKIEVARAVDASISAETKVFIEVPFLGVDGSPSDLQAHFIVHRSTGVLELYDVLTP